MSIVNITQRGSFSKTENYLRRLSNFDFTDIFNKYGALGVTALQNATPIDTSLSANSWYYTIEKKGSYQRLRWHNSNVRDGVPVVILIEYGHATRNGGLVQARPFIMEAIGPIMQQISEEVWKEVTKD